MSKEKLQSINVEKELFSSFKSGGVSIKLLTKNIQNKLSALSKLSKK